jgi:hypothetical protein
LVLRTPVNTRAIPFSFNKSPYFVPLGILAGSIGLPEPPNNLPHLANLIPISGWVSGFLNLPKVLVTKYIRNNLAIVKKFYLKLIKMSYSLALLARGGVGWAPPRVARRFEGV